MLYCETLTIPPNTPKDRAITKDIRIEEPLLLRIFVRIPAGHHALAYFSLWYGDVQIFPHEKYEWLSGDDESIVEDLIYELHHAPDTITLKGYNTDTKYQHSFIVRISATRYISPFWFYR